jgi:hypothetical protein
MLFNVKNVSANSAKSFEYIVEFRDLNTKLALLSAS